MFFVHGREKYIGHGSEISGRRCLGVANRLGET